VAVAEAVRAQPIKILNVEIVGKTKIVGVYLQTITLRRPVGVQMQTDKIHGRLIVNKHHYWVKK